jgi:ketosteroid isomerase-like protein
MLVLIASTVVTAQSADEQDIRVLLDEFLAKVDQEQMHDRFWADELIYTGSSGRRIGKKDIMAGFQDTGSSDEPKTTYTAEDVQIKVMGEVAILAFKLVANTISGEETSISSYYNSGTLQKQNGAWKVILWQATKIPDKN